MLPFRELLLEIEILEEPPRLSRNFLSDDEDRDEQPEDEQPENDI